MSEPARSTARPGGWVGDPAQLEKARRYRAFIKWGAIPFYVLVAASWILMLMGSAVTGLLLAVIVVWAAAVLVLQRRVSTIIGRKWSTWHEYKERKRQDDPWQRDEKEESNPVAGWMESADRSPETVSNMATNPPEPPRDPWWIRSPTWLLFGLFFVAVSAVVVVVVLAAADVAGEVAGTTVPDDAAIAPASTTTLPADVTVDTEPADVTVVTEPADVTINVEFDVGSEGVFDADPSGPICPAGSMTDEPGPAEQRGQQIVLEAVNVFTCEDGSGTFTVKSFVILYPDFTTTSDWIVTHGTADYTGLQGQGTGVSTPIDFPLKSGVLTGEMRID